ncbi:MAG: hypothetical protein JO100_03455 [Pseudonocardia sp.]|jgi:hypothetical protein|nr:hypothetical protein [Pseudonocardia sp.]
MSEIFAVHVVHPAQVRPTEFICRKLPQAEKHAAELSNDPGVLAAGVTRFVVDEPGTRQAAALYVRGVKQRLPYVSDDRTIQANGSGN